MKKALFILFLTFPAFASGPKYVFDEAKLNDELNNVYKDLEKIPQIVDVYSLTLAQIQALTPKRKGRMYFCTDCAASGVCISTGTTIGSFSKIDNRTTACN